MIDLLRASGFDVAVHLPHDDAGPVPASALGSHLVVQRCVRGEVLAQLLTIESAGVRCLQQHLGHHGDSRSPVCGIAAVKCRSRRASHPCGDELGGRARGRSCRPVVVKSRDGGVGRGAGVALLKPAATTELRHDAPEPIRSPAQLVDLAAGAGATLGLDIYNVDVIIGPDGPCVIDVNPFPGFRGIPGAADLVADHVRSLTGPHV